MSTTTPELKQITYWLTRDARAPVASEYLVSIGQAGRINSVYCITTVRPVKHRDPETGEVWVQGLPAHGIWWASRDKKAA